MINIQPLAIYLVAVGSSRSGGSSGSGQTLENEEDERAVRPRLKATRSFHLGEQEWLTYTRAVSARVTIGSFVADLSLEEGKEERGRQRMIKGILMKKVFPVVLLLYLQMVDLGNLPSLP